MVHHLFSDYGLVIVDGDDAALKSMFSSIMLDDLTTHNAHRLSSGATDALEQMGYKGQVYPREINLFYMEDGLRERIEEVNGRHSVLNTDLRFDGPALKNLVAESPEKLSPNVILRPLYQETILPNLAYIGGPAEVAYWLQLKPVFDYYHVPYPVVVPRLFAMIIPKAILKKVDKLGLDDQDLFSTFMELKEKILQRDSTNLYDLSDEMAALKSLFESIKRKAGMVDITLEGFVMGEYKNVEKSVDHLAKRIKKAEEQRHEIVLTQLQGVLEKLFPGGNLQERGR
ncbi:MAG: bacillithiol biosynthesis BshC [Cyclobacteriaceae bacterium]|nr:bacillithiol biosynthesis BshC [Cyclobacteriaceae bacterium]